MATVSLENRFAALRVDVAGEVILPGDSSYESQRKVWNGDFDRHPALIIRAVREEDVIVGLAFARANELEVTVRGGGHSFSGQSVADGALMLDLRRMNRITVDPTARRARVQAGATWGEIDKATQAHGLAVTGGQVSHTGVAGLTLGGGLGYMMRAHGLTIDNLVSAQVVTARGRLIRASADENADLFFGLRGGGGNFGIVTEFEFQLHPVGPLVLGGVMGWARDQGPAFLRSYAEFLDRCPQALTTTLIYLNMPPLPFIPEAMRKQPGWMVAVCGIDMEAADAAKTALAMLCEREPPRFNVVQPMPYRAVQSFLDKAEPFGTKLYGKSHFFNKISPELLLTLHEELAELPSRETKIFSLQMGGAVRAARDEDMAFSGRNAEMAMMFEAEWKDDSEKDRCVAWVRRLWSATEKFAHGTYNNFGRHLDDDTLKMIYGAQKYRKLQQIKTKFDPENIFHFNHNIKPLPRPAYDTEQKTVVHRAAYMRIRRVSISAFDVEETLGFYRDIFGFSTPARTPGGRNLLRRVTDGHEYLELELLQTSEYWRLPNPFHFAVEVNAAAFERIYALLKQRNAKIISDPPPAPNNGSYGEWVDRGVKYRRYFFADPNLAYLEVVNRRSPESLEAAVGEPEAIQIHHLILGAGEVDKSVAFYTNILGLEDVGENVHAEGARTLIHRDADGSETMELIVHPYEDFLVPNPACFSIEVDRRTFETVRAAAAAHQVAIFAEPDLPLVADQCGTYEVGGISYDYYFLVDPSMCRVEVMSRSDGEKS